MLVYNQIQYDARVIRAAEALSDIGYKVKVISLNSSLCFQNDKFESIVFQTKLRKRGALLNFWLRCLCYIFENRRSINLLYVHDYYLPIVGGICFFLLRIPWIYDAHELLFQHKTKRSSIRRSFFLFLERKFIRTAALVVAANEERRRLMEQIYHLKKSIYVLNVATNPSAVLFDNRKEAFIVYQGALLKERGVDFFINAQPLLKKRFYLKLIGGGPQLSVYMRKVEELGLADQIIFTGLIDQKRLYEESRHAMLGVVTYPLDDLNNYYCSPNKIFEYAHMKIPMIMSPQPFLVMLAEKYHIGEILDVRKGEEEYLRLVDKMIANYSYYTENMENFLRDFSGERELRKLQIAVQNINEVKYSS